MIRKGVETCIRLFKPRLTILFAALSLNEHIVCGDYANLMPDLNAKTTYKQIEETSMVMRTLEKGWDREKFFRSVSIFYL
jgi:hypothetical protein